MSMLALPEAECQEILELFRQHLSHVPDAWLQELASNYGLDALADIDPMDVIEILSVPGELHRFQVPLSLHESPVEVHRKMRNELAVKGIDPGRIIASLLTIHDSSSTLADIGEFVGLVAGDFPDDGKKGVSWYVSTRQGVSEFLCVRRE